MEILNVSENHQKKIENAEKVARNNFENPEDPRKKFEVA